MSDAAIDPAHEARAPGLQRRDLLVGGALAATAALTWARIPRIREARIGPGKLEGIVPLQFGAWHYQSASGIVLPPPDQLARLLYDQQASRYYDSTDELPVMLVMAYGSSQGGALQVHRPEVCYPASGFRLSHTKRKDVPLANGRQLPARFFSARSDTRVEQVLYFTRLGDDLPTSWTGQRLSIMRSNLSGDVPDGLLVRISCVYEDADFALATLQRFTRAMLAAAGPRGRQLLVGPRYA